MARRLILIAMYVAAIVASYLGFLNLIEWRIVSTNAFVRQAGLPLVLIGRPSIDLGASVEAVLALLTLAQSALLIGLFRAMKGSSDRRVYYIVALGVVLLALLSFRTDFTSSDLYHYVFYGRTASLADAYHASPHPKYPVPFIGLSQAVHDDPVAPSVYGPLWQAADRALVSRTANLGQASSAIRAMSLAALLALFALLIIARVRVAVMSVYVLNPSLYYNFVVQAHNDVFAILAVGIGVVLLARRQATFAIVFLVAASAIKINFVLVALAVLWVERSRAIRLRVAASTIVGSFALAYAIGGTAYIRAIAFVGGNQANVHTSLIEHVSRVGLIGLFAIIMLWVCGSAVVFGVAYRFGSLTFPGFSTLLHPWYFGWGLPYALTSDEFALPYASALPVVSFATDTALTDAAGSHFVSLIMAVVVALVMPEIVIARRTPIDANAMLRSAR